MISRFKNLAIGKKILVLGIFMTIPYLFVTYRMIAEINRLRLEFTSNEIRGTDYLLALRNLTEDIQTHRGMLTAYINGDLSFKARISKTQKKIQARLNELNEVDGKIGDDLGTGKHQAEIEQQAQKLLLGSLKGNAKDSFTKHTNLIGKINELKRLVGDTSNLVLDPELDTYYLMDIILVKMPLTLELLGQARGLSSGIAARGEITKNERDQILRFYYLISRSQEQIQASLKRASLANPLVGQKLNKLSRIASKNQKDFLETLKTEFITRDEPSLPPGRIFQSGSRALKASYALYDQTNPLLRILLVERENDYKRALLLTLLFSFLGLLAACFFGFLISRSIFNPLKKAAAFSETISRGDLTTELHAETKDEIGRLLGSMNIMSANINGIVSRLRMTSQQMDAMSFQLGDATGKFVESSQDQAAGAEQASASLEELSASIQNVANAVEMQSSNVDEINGRLNSLSESINEIDSSTRELESLAMNSVERGKKGQDVVQDATVAMEEIARSSADISEIMGIITDISEQTNLLALNASIEAARAGDAGRGFAVVAEEISRLADKTDESVKAIDTLIKQTGEAVQNGTKRVTESRSILNEIIQGIEKIENASAGVKDSVQTQVQNASSIAVSAAELSRISQEIKTSTQEQKKGAEEINTTVQSIANQTQHITADASNLKMMTKKLESFSNLMRDAIKLFKVPEGVFIKWNDSFTVNVAEIDEQHKQLFTLINELYQNIQNMQDEKSVLKTITALKEYTLFHFQKEEELMAKIEYHGLENHKNDHQDMIKIIERFRKDYEAGNTLVGFDILNFAGNWLSNHIMGVDRQYSESMNKKGVH